MFSKQQDYKIIASNDTYIDSFNPEPEGEKHNVIATIKTTRSQKLLWILCFILVILNTIFLSMLLMGASKPRLLTKKLSYRPASFNTVIKQFNGSLFPPKTPSWSRIGPGPEADSLWDWYEPLRLIPLSKDDVVELGKDSATAAQFPPDWNVPSGAYIGALDVFHKIHCLNELRKMTFEGYPQDSKPRTFQHHTTSALQWFHLRHCVDMIAQDLRCNAKLDVITYNWMDTQEQPFPDFSISKSCTNWDQFADWTVQNTLDPEEFHKLRRPSDVLPLPAEDGYYEMFGFGDSVLYPAGKGYIGQL